MTNEPTIDVQPLVDDGLVTDAVWVDEAASTNSVLLANSPFHNEPGLYLFGADTQTAGRGRGGNRWFSGDGALTFSLQLIGQATPSLVSLRTGVAVCEAVASWTAASPGLKWPNDVLVGDQKLSGILVEQHPAVGCVIGVGINVNNCSTESDPSIRDHSTSLREAHGSPVPRGDVLRKFIESLRHQLSIDKDRVIDSVNDWDALRNRSVVILDGPDQTVRVRGLANGITADGGLRIQHDETVTIIHSGTVRTV